MKFRRFILTALFCPFIAGAQHIDLVQASDSTGTFIFSIDGGNDAKQYLVNFNTGAWLKANKIHAHLDGSIQLYTESYKTEGVTRELIVVDSNLTGKARMLNFQYVDPISDTRYVAYSGKWGYNGFSADSVTLVNENGVSLMPFYKFIEQKNGLLLCTSGEYDEPGNYSVHDYNGKLLADSAEREFYVADELVVYDSANFTVFENGQPITRPGKVREYSQYTWNTVDYLILSSKPDSIVYNYPWGPESLPSSQFLFDLRTNTTTKMNEFDTYNYLVRDRVIVIDNNKMGVFTTSGTMILPVMFDYINLEYKDYDIPAYCMRAHLGGAAYDFDFNGDTLRESETDLPAENKIYPAIVEVDRLYGIEKNKDVFIIPPTYLQIVKTSNGSYLVKLKEGWGIRNADGRQLVQEKYYRLYEAAPGIYSCSIGTGKYDEESETYDDYKQVYLNAQGEIIKNLTGYNYITSGGPGKLIVSTLVRIDEYENETWLRGYTDYTGQIIVPVVYSMCSEFVNDRAVVFSAELKQLHLIDPAGAIITTIGL